ncbi:MAG: hypothetical protein ACM336_02165 [Acidobacteriota bacterium]
MPDQLNFSLWLRAFDSETMLRHFEEMLRVFPFSTLRPGIAAVRIYAVDYTEPAVLEQAFAAETDIDTVIQVCRDFDNPDCAYLVEGWWNLWRFDQSWQLTPRRVTLACFGPEFDNEVKDHLRIEVGDEADFLPAAAAPESTRKAQSNLASLVRLARELEQAMPVERRTLWSESGENFADRLDDAFYDEAR